MDLHFMPLPPIDHLNFKIQRLNFLGEFNNEDLQAYRKLIEKYLEPKKTLRSSTSMRLLQWPTYVRGNENTFWIASIDDQIIGGISLGPLHGLPASEGIGEIRELVVEKQFRGMGIGRRLFLEALKHSIELGYKRLYLATFPTQSHASRIFKNFGFKPIELHFDQSSEKLGFEQLKSKAIFPGKYFGAYAGDVSPHFSDSPNETENKPCYFLVDDVMGTLNQIQGL